MAHGRQLIGFAKSCVGVNSCVGASISVACLTHELVSLCLAQSCATPQPVIGSAAQEAQEAQAAQEAKRNVCEILSEKGRLLFVKF